MLFRSGMIKDKKVFEFSITPILTIILGLSFLIWQGQVIITFNKIIGGMLILIGAFNYVKCLINKKNAGEISGRNSIFATFFLILIVLGLFLYFFCRRDIKVYTNNSWSFSIYTWS